MRIRSVPYLSVLGMLGICIQLGCCDIHGNASGDYVGAIADQLGIDGNISRDPRFCDRDALDLRLDTLSPCGPDSCECGLMGAWPVGCE
ncbi:hypothetical protein ACFL6M_07735 [Candidatus Eisenbacteria bacterium]|uniref:Uncharacterized protein n=1 Tax=Eiseniibacteriota bacterium TaxID=2212470 RepID=A0ABV6YMA5_UNCEI